MTAAAPDPAGEQACLSGISRALGLDLSVAQAAALTRYLDLLESWNRTFNLTAVRTRAEMLSLHLADCLAVLGPLDRWRAGGRLLDVGSGGGLPGVVVAVLRSRWDVTCVDAVAKKAAFVRQVAGVLGLTNLRSEHARVEALGLDAFDVVTARAFASLADLVQGTRRLLAPGGVWMAMKGRAPAGEIAALPADVDVFHVEPLAVPGLDAARCLVWMRQRHHN